jgi:phosphoribosylglycinamide formyltransferase 2
MDREGIRRLAAEELGLPTSPYRFCDSLAELQAAIDGTMAARHRLPLRRQAGDEQLGQGPEQDRRPGRVQKAWDYAMAGGRVSHGRVIVEGFIDFDYEITQLTVRAAADGQVQTHFCDPIGHVQVSGDYGKLAAAADGPAALEGARHRPGRHRQPGRPGPVRRRALRQGRQVWFSEVSPRPHDTGLVTLSPSGRTSSSCTPAPSWACRWTPRCRAPAPAP